MGDRPMRRSTNDAFCDTPSQTTNEEVVVNTSFRLRSIWSVRGRSEADEGISLKRTLVIGPILGLALLAASVAPTAAANTSGRPPSEYILASVPVQTGGGAGGIFNELDGVA